MVRFDIDESYERNRRERRGYYEDESTFASYTTGYTSVYTTNSDGCCISFIDWLVYYCFCGYDLTALMNDRNFKRGRDACDDYDRRINASDSGYTDYTDRIEGCDDERTCKTIEINDFDELINYPTFDDDTICADEERDDAESNRHYYFRRKDVRSKGNRYQRARSQISNSSKQGSLDNFMRKNCSSSSSRNFLGEAREAAEKRMILSTDKSKGVLQKEKTVKIGDFYVGSYNSKGQKHGHGTCIYANGDRYVGEFTDNKRHGLGLYSYINGSSYNGMWQYGLRHGKGIFYYFNGNSFEGTFKNCKAHGFGVMTVKNVSKGEMKLKGEWANGKLIQKSEITVKSSV